MAALQWLAGDRAAFGYCIENTCETDHLSAVVGGPA
jgi:hypothetical protein